MQRSDQQANKRSFKLKLDEIKNSENTSPATDAKPIEVFKAKIESKYKKENSSEASSEDIHTENSEIANLQLNISFAYAKLLDIANDFYHLPIAISYHKAKVKAKYHDNDLKNDGFRAATANTFFRSHLYEIICKNYPNLSLDNLKKEEETESTIRVIKKKAAQMDLKSQISQTAIKPANFQHELDKIDKIISEIQRIKPKVKKLGMDSLNQNIENMLSKAETLKKHIKAIEANKFARAVRKFYKVSLKGANKGFKPNEKPKFKPVTALQAAKALRQIDFNIDERKFSYAFQHIILQALSFPNNQLNHPKLESQLKTTLSICNTVYECYSLAIKLSTIETMASDDVAKLMQKLDKLTIELQSFNEHPAADAKEKTTLTVMHNLIAVQLAKLGHSLQMLPSLHEECFDNSYKNFNDAQKAFYRSAKNATKKLKKANKSGYMIDLDNLQDFRIYLSYIGTCAFEYITHINSKYNEISKTIAEYKKVIPHKATEKLKIVDTIQNLFNGFKNILNRDSINRYEHDRFVSDLNFISENLPKSHTLSSMKYLKGILNLLVEFKNLLDEYQISLDDLTDLSKLHQVNFEQFKKPSEREQIYKNIKNAVLKLIFEIDSNKQSPDANLTLVQAKTKLDNETIKALEGSLLKIFPEINPKPISTKKSSKLIHFIPQELPGELLPSPRAARAVTFTSPASSPTTGSTQSNSGTPRTSKADESLSYQRSFETDAALSSPRHYLERQSALNINNRSRASSNAGVDDNETCASPRDRGYTIFNYRDIELDELELDFVELGLNSPRSRANSTIAEEVPISPRSRTNSMTVESELTSPRTPSNSAVHELDYLINNTNTLFSAPSTQTEIERDEQVLEDEKPATRDRSATIVEKPKGLIFTISPPRVKIGMNKEKEVERKNTGASISYK